MVLYLFIPLENLLNKKFKKNYWKLIDEGNKT